MTTTERIEAITPAMVREAIAIAMDNAGRAGAELDDVAKVAMSMIGVCSSEHRHLIPVVSRIVLAGTVESA